MAVQHFLQDGIGTTGCIAAQVSGDITYNGIPLSAFEPSQTVALVQQTDLHTPELTVRETLDHAARCQHTGYGAPPIHAALFMSHRCVTH